MNPVAALRARLDRWFLSRCPPSDRLELTQRNVYIVPTRAGWMLGVTLLVLLITSINYQLNLGYLLTFLLAGSVVMGMHVCHATLRGVALQLIAPEAQYARSAAVLRVVLHNRRRSVRYAIRMAVRGSGQWAWTDVPAEGSVTVEVAFQPERRGVHAVPSLTVETRFPLGTFRVWTVWRPAAQLLVYPAAELQPPPLPAVEPLSDRPAWAAAALLRSQGGGEYDGVRAYRRGDPLKLVVWKKAAKAQAAGSHDLVSREAQQTPREARWLDAHSTGLAEGEARLSRLCAWVAMADRLDVDYGLRVAGRLLAPAQGEAHRRACLELLATC